MASKRSEEVTNAFNKSVSKNDKSYVKEFTKEEIDTALAEYSEDRGSSFYVAMEQRSQELKEAKAQSLSKREKRKERLIGALLTIAVGLILWFIRWLLTMSLGSNTPS